MKDWKNFSRVIIIAFSSLLVLTGCKVSEEFDTDIGTNSGERVEQQSATLKMARAEDISDHLMECRKDHNGKKDKKDKKHKDRKTLCLEICHRPPGNPGNAKSKILPLKAVLKHIAHGGPNHSHHDTIGPCEEDGGEGDEMDPDDPDYGNDDDGDDEDSDDEGENDTDEDENNDENCNDDEEGDSDDESDENDSDEDGDIGIGTDDPEVEEEDTPQYCIDNLEFDADCDGYDDESGQPLY